MGLRGYAMVPFKSFYTKGTNIGMTNHIGSKTPCDLRKLCVSTEL